MIGSLRLADRPLGSCREVGLRALHYSSKSGDTPTHTNYRARTVQHPTNLQRLWDLTAVEVEAGDLRRARGAGAAAGDVVTSGGPWAQEDQRTEGAGGSVVGDTCSLATDQDGRREEKRSGRHV